MNKTNRSQHIATLFPAKRDVIAFAFAGRLKVNQKNRITSGTYKSCASKHAQPIRANAGQK